jgi:hypothetical protein
MFLRVGIVTLAFISALPGLARAQQPKAKPVEIEKTWTETVPKDQLAQLDNDMTVGWKKLPGAVTSQAAWKKVWTVLKPGMEAPQVDFSKKLILVHIQDGVDPNKVSHKVQLTDKGVLRILSISTLIGFEPSNLRKVTLLQVSRAGAKALQIPGKGEVPLPGM